MFHYPVKTKTAVIILIICGFVVFGNSLGNDFNLDDGYYTHGNPLTSKGFRSIPGIIQNPTLFGARGDGFDYRPVTAISFAIQHQLFGDAAGTGHFINLLLYLATVLTLFVLLLRWLDFPNKVSIAFWISLLYLVHPLHTEVVDSIKSRDEILSLLFVLISALFASNFARRKKLFAAVLALLFFGLALFSKYTVLPFAFLIPVALYFFHGYSFSKASIAFAIYFGFGVLCHVWKNTILPDSDHIFSITENGLANPVYGWSERIATSIYVMGRYLFLHFIPAKLVFYYGYAYVPVVGWNNVLVWLSLLLHVALIYYCIRNYKTRNPIVYGLLVYLSFMLVYSNIPELSPGMMAERFTYASTLGFCMALVFLLDRCKERLFRFSNYLKPVYILLPVALVFAARTIARNNDWKDKETLYTHDVQEAPESAMVNFLMGDWKFSKAMADRQAASNASERNRVFAQTNAALAEAEIYYQKVLSINPKDSLAEYNLVSCAIQLGNLEEAERRSNALTKKYPHYWDAWFMLGVVQSQRQKHNEAVVNFKKVIENDAPFIPAYEQLHRQLLLTGDTASGLQVLKKAMEKFPESPVAYAEMANYHLAKLDTISAITYAEKAAALPPVNPGLLQFLANYFEKRGEPVKATLYRNKLEELSTN